ncbi:MULTISPECIES: glutathione S-transferase family protein [Roseobacteraceae]|uniref:glutathione transferase n=1 Tax=Pseudosulfitobacter pseudonitzschiae TaxID=1402135 RepID=A0A221K260_9RHOB|nr:MULTISPECIES: glutathione S-transferase family protein [Roseobacteraceae]ASM73076.1 stringent starvation protein A [Pseudosulfitobacter pseudonitzschiae]
MTRTVTLHGYRYSVYTRMAHLALRAKKVVFDWVEVNPFLSEGTPPHPFGRVPVLDDDGFRLFETGAITRHIDRAFDGPALSPLAVQPAARMDQCIAVIDNYAYWPLIRQVFAHAVFRPLEGETADAQQIAKGLAAAGPVLNVLDQFAQEGHILDGKTLTLADCHLIPIIDYFTRAPQGQTAVASCPALERWWGRMQHTPLVQTTDPQLPGRP